MADATAWIATVLARATELRAAGVLALEVDGCSVQFAAVPPPLVPVGDIDKPDASTEDIRHLLNDPASYPDGVVPGFTITKFEIED